MILFGEISNDFRADRTGLGPFLMIPTAVRSDLTIRQLDRVDRRMIVLQNPFDDATIAARPLFAHSLCAGRRKAKALLRRAAAAGDLHKFLVDRHSLRYELDFAVRLDDADKDSTLSATGAGAEQARFFVLHRDVR